MPGTIINNNTLIVSIRLKAVGKIMKSGMQSGYHFQLVEEYILHPWSKNSKTQRERVQGIIK